MSNIQFPYAVDENNKVWHINDVPTDSGMSFRCICNERMAPRALTSTKVTRHFFHIGEPCPSDYRLHEIAKRFIQEGINRGNYHLGVRCSLSLCNGVVGTELSSSSAVCELSIIPNTRSDIVVLESGNPSFIIEIVVTHELEDETHDKYLRSPFPVFVVHPEIERLRELRRTATASFMLGEYRNYCPDCVEHRRKINIDLESMRNALVSDTRGSRAALKALGFIRQPLHPVAQEITGRKYPRDGLYKYPMPRSQMDISAYPDQPTVIRLRVRDGDYSGAFSQWLEGNVKKIISSKYPSICVTVS